MSERLAAAHCTSAFSPGVSPDRCGAAAPWSAKTSSGGKAYLCSGHLKYWQRRGGVESYEPIKTSGAHFEIRICEDCGNQFEPVRMAQRFCQATCRMRWWREHQPLRSHNCRCGKACTPTPERPTP